MASQGTGRAPGDPDESERQDMVLEDGADDGGSPLDHRAADPTPRARADKNEIPSLHGLRAVAILLVIIGHASETLELTGLPHKLEQLIPTAAFGVNVFFVLSGYLITRIVMGHITRKDRSLKAFYARRALRLMPALYVFVAINVILGALGAISMPTLAALSAVLFMWDYSPFTLGVWWLGHTWSLAIEEQFYLLWAPVLMKLGQRRAAFVAAAIIVLVPIVRVAEYFAFPDPDGYIRIRGDSMLHTRADVLMVGCLLALVWDHPRTQELIARFTKKPLLVAALIYLVISAYLINNLHGKWSQSVGNSLDAFAIAFVMIYAIVHHRGGLGRFLNSRAMVQVGLMSYSLYLWQQMFLTTFNHGPTGTFPLNVICTFAAATLSYYLVEIPFLNLRRRLM